MMRVAAALVLLLAACGQGEQIEPGPIPCAADQHVFDGLCQPCSPGTANEAGDDPLGADTTCDPVVCGVDEHVSEHRCSPCPPGSNRAAGDDAAGADTACEPVLCGANEAVMRHQCFPCPRGYRNHAGNDASGPDTFCTACPPGTFDEGDHRCQPCALGSISEAAASECSPCAAGSYATENRCESCPSDLKSAEGASACHVEPLGPLLGLRDYGYLYWPTNHRDARGRFTNLQHVQTGFYGLTFDVGAADIRTMGPWAEALSARDAAHRPAGALDSLPGAAIRYGVEDGDQRHAATGFFGRERAPTNPSELIDMGRFLQRIEIPEVTYADADLTGSIQLAAMPRQWVLSQRVVSRRGGRDLTLKVELSGAVLAAFPNAEWVVPERMLSLRNGAGEGWTFAVQAEQGAVRILRSDDGGLRFERRLTNVAAGRAQSLSVVGIPSTAASPAQLRFWQDRAAAVQVEFAQLRLDGTPNEALTAAAWDPERGTFVLPLRNLRDVGAPGGRNFDAHPTLHNWYNRYRLVVTNHDPEPISVPIAFDGGGNATTYIVAGSPLFRSGDGEPLGLPIQISKNWHDPPAWYHLYSQFLVPSGRQDLELTFPHSKWGEAYAVAHAQLSLIGWGQNQQWDQSAIGAFGESITYDPDLTLRRAMVDDVRPFLVDAGRRWNWTGNVGGADFLRYVDDQGVHQRLGRMRSHYELTGPNLTRVITSGISADGAVRATITTQLTRTDDLVRAIYHLDYELLDTVEYRRFALFQMAADRYADNGFTRYVYGNADAVIGGDTITDHRSTGYADPSHRGIPIDGAAPWVMLFNNQRRGDNLPERLANIGFVVRDYRAQLGDEVLTTPHINLNRTFNGGFSQIGFELGLPFDPANRVLPAGSRLQATIEFLVPPAEKAAYYGQSDHLTALPAEDFQSPAMMLHLAKGNAIQVEATVGELRRRHPIELIAEEAATAAEFTISGGLGYVPVSIAGLARPDGWRLEQQRGDAWQRVDQSVHGNDYWQAYQQADGRFELLFNLPNRGVGRYRLVR